MCRVIGDGFYLAALGCLLYHNIGDVVKSGQAAFLSHKTLVVPVTVSKPDAAPAPDEGPTLIYVYSIATLAASTQVWAGGFFVS